MESIFLDSNVIANWILIGDIFSNGLDFEKDKILNLRLEKLSYSYILIEALFENDDYEIKTCSLALGEIFHVIHNELLSLKMYRKGIPLTLWSKLRRKYDLTEEEQATVRNIINKYIKKLRKKVIETDDKVDDKIYPKLALGYKLRTHDAVLLTTAILEKCSWFITNDTEIIELNKKAKKKLPKISELFGITPDFPHNFIRVIK